ncbi:hypothetical protein BJX65DRAFT_267513 [Aspergillus insuetus]
MGLDVDMDVDNNENETEPSSDNDNPPHYPIQDLMHHRPQAPFIYFPEGPFFPAAVPPQTSSLRGTPSGQTSFVIYEDTHDMAMAMDMDMDMNMDGDGEGNWESSPGWFLSPEENKENADEEERDGHGHLQQHDDGYILRSDGYDLAFAGMEPYVHPSIEREAYHNSSQGLHDYGSAHAQQNALQGSGHYPSMRAPAGTGNGYMPPSSGFLSATEVSLHAIPGQTPQNESTHGLRQRRSRRAIRSRNIVCLEG